MRRREIWEVKIPRMRRREIWEVQIPRVRRREKCGLQILKSRKKEVWELNITRWEGGKDRRYRDLEQKEDKYGDIHRSLDWDIGKYSMLGLDPRLERRE